MIPPGFFFSYGVMPDLETQTEIKITVSVRRLAKLVGRKQGTRPVASFSINAVHSITSAPTVVAAGLAAVFYVIAMIAMKHWADAPSSPLTCIILAGLTIGTMFEIIALRGERLGMIYVTILALEVVLIAVAARVFLGEQFTTREVAGCALVMAGTALAWT